MIRLLEAFAGYGGASFALKKAGIPFETIGISEIDRYAIECYNQNFPNVKNYGDITKINPEELPDFDLFTGGFPCFFGKELVTSKRGLIPIKEIVVGDEVLTHKNRFRKVIRIGNRMKKGIYNIKIQGSPSTLVTEEHPYYCRKMIRSWNNKNRDNKRMFSNPEWIKTKELREDDFIGFGIWNKHLKNEKQLTNEECWLLGRYIADGFLPKKDKVVRYCIGKKKIKEFKKVVKRTKYTFSIYESETIFNFRLKSDRLVDLCLDCGNGAINKKVPFWIMNLPINKLKHFLNGYMSGDGCLTHQRGNPIYSASSISKVLIYQLGQIVNKLFKTPYVIYQVKKLKKGIICGRIVNLHDSWELKFQKETKKQQNAKWIDKNLWTRFSEKEWLPEWKGLVYNIEVEKDHSYVVNNCIVKNCTDVSLAGSRDLSKGRTNLYKEILRIVKVKRPKYIVLENVKGLLSIEVDERKLHLQIVSDLQKIGYGVCWKVLNSKDFGIPQNRERIWFVCKLGGWNFMEFQFPNPKPLKIFLKDILEKEVDKKYYLSETIIKGFLKHKERSEEKGYGFLFEPQEKENLLVSSCITSKEGTRSTDNYILEQNLNQKTRDVETAINLAKDIADKENKPVQIDLYHLQSGEIRPLSTYIPQDLDVSRCLQAGEPKEILVEPIPKLSDVFPCLNPNDLRKGFSGQNQETFIKSNMIRKLTPKEAFRLMGFFNDEIKLEDLSDTQRYKLAGNGWALSPVSEIFRNIFKEQKNGKG